MTNKTLKTPSAARSTTPPVDSMLLWGTSGDPAVPALLVVHRGKEVIFVAGATAAQARAVLSSFYPSLAPPARAPAPSASRPRPSSKPLRPAVENAP